MATLSSCRHAAYYVIRRACMQHCMAVRIRQSAVLARTKYKPRRSGDGALDLHAAKLWSLLNGNLGMTKKSHAGIAQTMLLHHPIILLLGTKTTSSGCMMGVRERGVSISPKYLYLIINIACCHFDSFKTRAVLLFGFSRKYTQFFSFSFHATGFIVSTEWVCAIGRVVRLVLRAEIERQIVWLVAAGPLRNGWYVYRCSNKYANN